MSRVKKPSNAVTKGTAVGVSLGALLEAAFTAYTGGVLPPGTGAVIGGLVTSAAAYFFRGGRQGEGD